MSAYVVEKDLIDTLIAGALRAKLFRFNDANTWGKVLWRENVKSVAYRYQLATRDPKELADYERDVAAYEYEPCEAIAPAVVDAIDCLDYQSCEHDEWQSSAAFDLLERLRLAFPQRQRAI
jgi:hypothetical protein